MAELHLAVDAHTVLRGWYSPAKNVMLRADYITGIKVTVMSNKFTLVVSFNGEKQEFHFQTLESLNEALSPLHLSMTDLEDRKGTKDA